MGQRRASRRTGVWLCLAMMWAGVGCAGRGLEDVGRGTMTLVDNGRPVATIVVAADANEIVKAAVNDLQRCVRKMSGAELPIAHAADTPGNLILVGRMPAVEALIPDLDTYDLDHDGIVIRSLPGKLVLTGQSDGVYHPAIGDWIDKGTPNAVYTFLDMLGCRWYGPGEDGEVVPHWTTVTIQPLNVVRKPDFKGRWIGSNNAWYLGGKSNDSKIFRQYLTWLRRNRVGQNGYHGGHTLRAYLNADKYFAAHPEWFSLVDGRRVPDGQACVSNPEIYDVIASGMGAGLDRQTGFRSVGMGLNDTGGHCECDNCQAMDGEELVKIETKTQALITGTVPGQYRNLGNRNMKFVNGVARRMAESHPDVLVTFYAVYTTAGTPEDKPLDNVIPTVCHIYPNDEEWRREVATWEEISRQLYYYGYMGHKIALPKLRFAEDIRWCHEHKGTVFSCEANEYSPVLLQSLYLTARALWDTTIAPQAVMAEFYRDYYGGAAEPMRRFWETFDGVTRQAVLDYDCHYKYPDTVTPQVVVTLGGCLTEALGLADRPVVERRIGRLVRYWRATELHVAMQQAVARWRQAKTEPNRADAERAVRDTLTYIDSVSDEFFLNERTGPLFNALNEVRTRLPALDGEVLVSLPEQWLFRTDPDHVGEKQRWFDVATDLTPFRPISTSRNWEVQGVGSYDGYAWYLVDVVIPETGAKRVWLLFGAVDETWKLWIDGQYIGASTGLPGEIWDQPAAIEITGKYPPGKKVRLAVQVHDSVHAGGIWKPVTITTTE